MGIPGCGKSALLSRLIIALNPTQYKCYIAEDALLLAMSTTKEGRLLAPLLKLTPFRLTRKKAHAVFRIIGLQGTSQCRFIAQRANALQALLESDLFSKFSSTERALALARFCETASMYQLIHEKLNAQFPVIFDEGFLQRTMSLFLTPGIDTTHFSNRHLRSYLSNVPQPALVIWVDAATEVCYKRMRYRRKGLPIRLQGFAKNTIVKFLNTSREHFEIVSEWMIYNNKRVIRVSNEGNFDNILKSLNNDVINFFNKKYAE
ncbi:hypothetical protein QUF75_00390 [Desulfococcaceae bacterium HSG7]|nr:hypothetical protein [Desulfococcaceae bacterium HSG7]